MSGAKDCPWCGLVNAGTALLCDCGYDFGQGVMPGSVSATPVLPISATLSCPVCARPTNSLKQYRVIHTIIAIPLAAVHRSVVYQGCPRCMRAFIWERCLINGLTTWIAGFLILIPYTLALTFATLLRGHSWPVLYGITPAMQLHRTWVARPSGWEKALAILSAVFCIVPGIGIFFSWWALWKLHWRTGWVHDTAQAAAFIAYLVTVITFFMFVKYSWH